ncbi:MAG: SIS domain-containing protein [Bacteroidota bacterium]
MNAKEKKYNQFALCCEMMDTGRVINQIPETDIAAIVQSVKSKKGLFITGEGSSRIIPAKHVIYENLLLGSPLQILTEGATQALEYKLNEMAVVGISNSGKTKEIIRLFQALKAQHHEATIGITAGIRTPLEVLANESIVLNCGAEKAVAATKSVVEQVLILERIVDTLVRKPQKDYYQLAEAFMQVLRMNINSEIIHTLAKADTLYFAGRNTGVAEELTLKTNEITRKKSDFLEGTYCLHGIEEVMKPGEILILIDPFAEEEEKIREVLVEGVGMQVVAIAPRQTLFETILIPDIPEFKTYLNLAAGWNLLVETGIELGINLDKPERARKIGNELTPQVL